MGKSKPVRKLTEQEVQAISEILERGDNVEIKTGKDGDIIILEVKRKIASRYES